MGGCNDEGLSISEYKVVNLEANTKKFLGLYRAVRMQIKKYTCIFCPAVFTYLFYSIKRRVPDFWPLEDFRPQFTD